MSDCSDDSTGPSPNEKGHFSAKFNGDYWTPSVEFSFPSIPSHSATIQQFSSILGRYRTVVPLDSFSKYFRIKLIGHSTNPNRELSLTVDSVQGVGSYTVSIQDRAVYRNIIYSYSDIKSSKVNIAEIFIDTSQFYDSSENVWLVEILPNSFVKGTFEIECEKDGSKLNIKEGKFYMESTHYTFQ